MHIYILTSTNIYAAQLCMYICTCMHTYTQTYIHTHTYIHTYIHIHTYICTCMHANIHIYKHAHIHIYIHMHTYIHPVINCSLVADLTATEIQLKSCKRDRSPIKSVGRLRTPLMRRRKGKRDPLGPRHPR